MDNDTDNQTNRDIDNHTNRDIDNQTYWDIDNQTDIDYIILYVSIYALDLKSLYRPNRIDFTDLVGILNWKWNHICRRYIQTKN